MNNNGNVNALITDNIDLWTSAIKKRNATGRGSSKKIELTGIKKLRELILELAVRGKLVPQDVSDEPASVLLERIATEKAQLIAEKKIKKTKAIPAITDKEQPFNLPHAWEWNKLGNLSSDIHYGYTASAKHDCDGVRLLRITDIQNNKVDWHTVPACEISQIKAQSYLLVNDDILIARTGGTIGKSYLVENIDLQAVFASYLIRVKRISAMYAPFIKTYLGSQLYWGQLYDNASGTGQPNVNATALKGLAIPIPPLAEQHRIVAKVDQLMLLCDQLELQTEQSLSAQQTLVEVLLVALTNSQSSEEFQTSWLQLSEHFDLLFTTEASIEQLKQTILQLAVMGKLVPQNPSDQPASALLEKIAEEKAQLIADKKIKKQKPSDEENPFELPSNWDWVRLGDVYRFLNGFAFKSEWFQEQGTKLLRNINIAHGETKWLETACIPKAMADEYSRFELEAGDIVISLDRPIINTGLKYAVIQTTDLPCLLLQRVAKFHSLADIVTPAFLSRWLESDLFMSSIDPGRSNGVPHISTKQLEMMTFPLCSSNEQHRIVAKVDQLMTLCEQLKARLSDAQTTQLHLADAVVANALN